MNPKLRIIYFFVDIVSPLFFGYLLSRQTKIKKGFFDRMMVANILLFGTLLSILSFWVISLDVELIWLPLLGVVMQVIPGIIVFLRGGAKPQNPLDRGSYFLSAMLSNRGVVGTLTVFIFYGEEGYAYARLVMLFAGVVLFLFCFPMARYFYETYKGQQGDRPSLVSILLHRNQVPILGIIVGLGLNYNSVPRPAFFAAIFPNLVHISAWLFLIPIGFSMDFGEMRRHWHDVLELLGIKFVATPLLVYILARAVGLSGSALSTVAILSCSPTAINAVVTSKLFSLNVHLAMAAFVLTTIVYLSVVFPLILLFVRI